MVTIDRIHHWMNLCIEKVVDHLNKFKSFLIKIPVLSRAELRKRGVTIMK
jgi:hypothetical protein